jgi:hypothetical protein
MFDNVEHARGADVADVAQLSSDRRVRRAVSPRRSLPALFAATIAAVALSGCAVTPSVPFSHTTFEGFEVISHVPAQPRGLVFLFHGTNGSAAFAERVETVDVLNRLIAAGYGFVSTSSTERTGDRRWNVANASLTGNPDLARLRRLHQHLVDTTAVEAGTPLVGIGMSNGSRFVTLWGEAFKDGGYPVRAIWASMGRIANPVDGPGELTVPTVFSTAENDFTSPPGPIIANYDATRAAGTPAELYVSRERNLGWARYMRIPGIDESEARQIWFSLIATGVWNGEGARIVPDIQEAAARVQAGALPPAVAPQRGEIESQTALQLAVHQFTAEYAPQVEAFFGRYVPRP